MKKFFCTAFILTFLATGLCASSAFAQTSPSTPLPQLSLGQASTSTSTEALIHQLQSQIKALQTRINELEIELGVKPASPASSRQGGTSQDEQSLVLPAFDRALSLGSTGDDVRNLQQFLAQDKEVYPEGLITAYYGPLTEKAIKKFQEKHQIISSGASETTGYGRIGPKTRSKLNELLTEGAGVSRNVPPGLLTAPGIQKKVATTTPTTTPSSTATTTPSGTIPAIPAQPIDHTGTTTVPATPAQPATGTPPPPPPGGTTPPPSPTPSPVPPPSTTFFYTPTITITSPTTASTYTATSSYINIYASIYDKDGGVATSTVFVINLATGTKYSMFPSGGAGKIWVSAPITLVSGTNNITINADDFDSQTGVGAASIVVTYTPSTSAPPSSGDITAPTISNVQTSAINTSVATMTWTTNESSDSWVEYGVTTAYGLTIVYYIPVTTNHSVTLSVLNAGTTYHFRVKSTDAAGNMATSGDYTFTTSAPPAQCNDAIDNDGDGKIDMNDLDCTSPTDNNESFEGSKKITIAVPNGNDKWAKGQTHQIQWSHPLTAGFDGDKNFNWNINADREGSTGWYITSVPVTQSYYNWVIPTTPSDIFPASSNYKIRIFLSQGCYYNPCPSPPSLLPDGITDSSDSTFTITSSSASLPAPTLASLLQSLSVILSDIQKQIQKLVR